MEGNLRFKIDGASLIVEVVIVFQAPGGLYLEGRFNGGFFALQVWGAYIWRGLFSELYGNYSCRYFLLCFFPNPSPAPFTSLMVLP